MQQHVANRRRLAAQQSLEVVERQLRLQRRAGVHEIGDRLGLHEIEFPVEDGALGELSRLSDARTESDACLDDLLHKERIAVERQLDEIVAGKRTRGGVADGDAVVNIMDLRMCGNPLIRKGLAGQRRQDRPTSRSVDPNDRQRAATERSRRRHDRVGGAHDSVGG